MQILDRLFGKAPASQSDAGLKHYEELLGSLFVMAWFVEARDPYTGGHLWRVSRYAQLLARAGRLTPVQVALAGLGGFLHDLGKIGVPDAILRKPDKLTDGEYDIIKTHPTIGMRMLAAHPLAHLVRDAVLLHHERPDGKGYPFGLQRDEIPQVARLVGVCDTFDALTSARPYRSAMPIPRALGILRELSGTQLDSEWVAHFQHLGQDGVLSHIQGHSDDGIRLQECPMCGPTLVVRRDQHAGDALYCRNCTGAFVLEQTAEHALRAVATGGQGRPQDMEPEADHALIARSIHDSLNLMPVQELQTLAVQVNEV